MADNASNPTDTKASKNDACQDTGVPPYEITTIAFLLSVLLSNQLTLNELETLVNLVNLTLQNLVAILAQKQINDKITDGVDISPFKI